MTDLSEAFERAKKNEEEKETDLIYKPLCHGCFFSDCRCGKAPQAFPEDGVA